MVTHCLDVKLHTIHYFKSTFIVYFHIKLGCKIKVNSTCSIKPSQCVNTRKLCDCDNTNHHIFFFLERWDKIVLKVAYSFDYDFLAIVYIQVIVINECH